MRLEAHLTASDFHHVFEQLTPLSVALDPEVPHRQLALEPPSHVSLLAGQGLRIITDLRLQWDVIGVRFPVTLRRVVILLSPSMIAVEGRQALVFGLHIEDADLSAIPSLLREVLVSRVNDALAKNRSRIAWRFMDTLDFGFPLPHEIRPPYTMRLFARSGDVEVYEDSLRLSVEWGLTAQAETGDGTAS
jgi:hypothetical protein